MAGVGVWDRVFSFILQHRLENVRHIIITSAQKGSQPPEELPGGGTAAHRQQDHNRQTHRAQGFHQNDQKAILFCERDQSYLLIHSAEIRSVLCKQREMMPLKF